MKAAFARGLLLSAMVVLGLCSVRAESRVSLGAQIWIEPGQTSSQIDTWFRDLADSHMPVARLFLMWPYLESTPDKWDFSLYDTAFRAAEKYHIHIVATLTPNGRPAFLGGDGGQGRGLPPTEQDKQLAADYIAKVVKHYRSSSALDTWLLVNEPGQRPVADPAAITAFRRWVVKQYSSVERMNAVWGTAYKNFDEALPPDSGEFLNRSRELDWRTFWEDYQTSQLRWLADAVRESDRHHPVHVNPAGLLSNLAGVSDDLPSWRPFLDSLGCSIHPAWHFKLLNRDQYALGVSYLNDLVRGSIEPKPYWVTELQGGNNIYSSHKPMNPTPQDIAQWVWTSIGAGADRVIFWLLNSRAEGYEAGEWSMLDFQGRPSARLRTASSIANIVNQHERFFSQARPYDSPVTIVLSLETMTFEEAFRVDDDPARSRDAHIMSALGFYEAISRSGPPPNIKYFSDYEWSKETSQPRVAILPDARELTESQVHSLRTFVEHGNTLLITGLTGFYGPHAKAWPLAEFPLAEITGGRLKEVNLQGKTPMVSVTTPSGAVLPSRLWVSSIDPSSATPIGQQDGEVIGTERNLPGGGKVIWIPSPIGLGAWLTDAHPLARYLQMSLNAAQSAPFRLARVEDNCLLRVLENQGTYLTILTNGGGTSRKCGIKIPAGLHGTALWGPSPLDSAAGPTYTLEPYGTSVQLWQ